jgi:hypothetical protein
MAPRTSSQIEKVGNPLTQAAFAQLRQRFPAQPPVTECIKNGQELDQMPAEELSVWCDGDQRSDFARTPAMLSDEDDRSYPVQLWVLRPDALVYAPEASTFGAALESGVIKHTNLTGGRDAHSGGELRLLGENTVVVNGASGRYGPRTEEALHEVVRAFKASGYRVFWTGYDAETNRPAPLVGVRLKLVA